MRIELGSSSSTAKGTTRIFLEKDDRTGQFYHVQSGPQGDRRLLLDAAVDQPCYREAVEAVQALVEKADGGLKTNEADL